MIQQTCGYKNKLLGLVVKDRLYLNFFFSLQWQFPLQHKLCTIRNDFFQALFRSNDIISSFCMIPPDSLSTEQLYLLEWANIIDVLFIAQQCIVKWQAAKSQMQEI